MISPAGVEHLAQVSQAWRARLLTHDVFAGFRSANDPMLAQTGGHWEVHRIDILRRDQLFVTTECARRLDERCLALAERDEVATALGVTAGDGSHDAIPTVKNGSPILLRDLGGAKDAPAEFAFVHGQIRLGD